MAKKPPPIDPWVEANRVRREEYHKRMAAAEARGVVVKERPLPDGIVNLDESRLPDKIKERLSGGIQPEEWPFYFTGDVGRGKSYSAAAFYRRARGPALWMGFTDFCERSRRLATDGELGIWNDGRFCEYTRESWWRHLSAVSLVVVDDIGLGQDFVGRTEAIWNLLERRKGKPLILTGNLPIEELNFHFDGRVQSRIMSGTFFDFGGRDQRIDGFENRYVHVNIKD